MFNNPVRLTEMSYSWKKKYWYKKYIFTSWVISYAGTVDFVIHYKHFYKFTLKWLHCFFCPCLSSQAVNNYKKERGHGKSQTQRCSTTPAPSPAPTPPPLTVQLQPQKHQQVRILRLLSGKKTVFFLLVCERSCLFHKLILALFFILLQKLQPLNTQVLDGNPPSSSSSSASDTLRVVPQTEQSSLDKPHQ